MAELRTEEEQLDAIKRWWKENGTALIAGVAIAIAAVVGWNAWQSYQENQAQAASMRYQHLVNLTAEAELDATRVSEAQALVAEITDSHSRTLYADLARLIDARLAVSQGELGQARDTLESLIDASRRDYIQGLARLRLARLQLEEARRKPRWTLFPAPSPPRSPPSRPTCAATRTWRSAARTKRARPGRTP